MSPFHTVGDGGFREKIDFIDSALYPSTEQSFHRGFVYPLLAAVLFVLLAPLIRRWVAVFTGERDAVTTAELLKVAGKTPLSPEKADALRQNLFDERQRRVDEKRALDGQVSELNAQVDLLLKKQSDRALVPASVEPSSAQGEIGSQVSNETKAASYPLVLPLKEADFIGGAQKYVIKLGQSGLTPDQARVLHAVRNSDEFNVHYVMRMLEHDDEYTSQVLLDKLLGLGLIEMVTMDTRRITSLGRQALAAVLGRGFSPTLAA